MPRNLKGKELILQYSLLSLAASWEARTCAVFEEVVKQSVMLVLGLRRILHSEDPGVDVAGCDLCHELRRVLIMGQVVAHIEPIINQAGRPITLISYRQPEASLMNWRSWPMISLLLQSAG